MLWTTVDVTKDGRHHTDDEEVIQNKDGNIVRNVNHINSSPTTSFQPVVYVVAECENEIRIPGKL